MSLLKRIVQLFSLISLYHFCVDDDEDEDEDDSSRTNDDQCHMDKMRTHSRTHVSRIDMKGVQCTHVHILSNSFVHARTLKYSRRLSSYAWSMRMHVHLDVQRERTYIGKAYLISQTVSDFHLEILILGKVVDFVAELAASPRTNVSFLRLHIDIALDIEHQKSILRDFETLLRTNVVHDTFTSRVRRVAATETQPREQLGEYFLPKREFALCLALLGIERSLRCQNPVIAEDEVLLGVQLQSTIGRVETKRLYTSNTSNIQTHSHYTHSLIVLVIHPHSHSLSLHSFSPQNSLTICVYIYIHMV